MGRDATLMLLALTVVSGASFFGACYWMQRGVTHGVIAAYVATLGAIITPFLKNDLEERETEALRKQYRVWWSLRGVGLVVVLFTILVRPGLLHGSTWAALGLGALLAILSLFWVGFYRAFVDDR